MRQTLEHNLSPQTQRKGYTAPKGVPTPKRERSKRADFHSKRASATKSGPGRFGRSGEPGNRLSKSRPVRAYKALMDAWAAKRVTKGSLRDDHGAITLIGSPVELVGVKPSSREFEIEGGSDHGERFYTVRRIWLAGISAMRGY